MASHSDPLGCRDGGHRENNAWAAVRRRSKPPSEGPFGWRCSRDCVASCCIACVIRLNIRATPLRPRDADSARRLPRISPVPGLDGSRFNNRSQLISTLRSTLHRTSLSRRIGCSESLQACKPASLQRPKRVHNTTQFAKAQASPPAKEPASTTRMSMDHAPRTTTTMTTTSRISTTTTHGHNVRMRIRETSPFCGSGRKLPPHAALSDPIHTWRASLQVDENEGREQGTWNRRLKRELELDLGAGAQKRHTSRPSFCPFAVNHLEPSQFLASSST
ncbi:hypothetical protein BGZ61DRAFT_60377 [Ilyonectria robusta]|uniref:uncharacterized protein n=1 Tax=Ilyonectria robusta TaxID=1079257 RepID=UPI001E8ED0BE|nr:uncharacterized protein BGZ61DRAFT_60377 [Ilyonectria robusta]KAH8684154.1 hypothetical protein BGZ61DRAFT_60377 [Ilyonectria robusta]